MTNRLGSFVSDLRAVIKKNGFFRAVFILMPKPLHDKIYASLVEESLKEKDKQAEALIVSLTAIGLMAAFVTVVLIVIDLLGHSRQIAWLGTFGDFFGGVLNPLLTFGTFIGLSITIILQRVQLHEARGQYQKNVDAASVQTFETSFFNLINLHNSIAEGLRFDPKVLLPNSHQKGKPKSDPMIGKPAEGRQVFEAILTAMKGGHDRQMTPEEVYEEIQDRHNYVLGHYFRNLYQIIKLVDRHRAGGLDGERNVDFYRSVIRAQLSSNELLLLFYNCREGKMDTDKFLGFVKRYELLEHVPLLITRSRNLLVVPSFGPFKEELYSPYLEFVDANKTQVASMGAFGKNKIIRQYLIEKGMFKPEDER